MTLSKWEVIGRFCTKFVLMECACFAVWRREYRENRAKLSGHCSNPGKKLCWLRSSEFRASGPNVFEGKANDIC